MVNRILKNLKYNKIGDVCNKREDFETGKHGVLNSLGNSLSIFALCYSLQLTSSGSVDSVDGCMSSREENPGPK